MPFGIDPNQTSTLWPACSGFSLHYRPLPVSWVLRLPTLRSNKLPRIIVALSLVLAVFVCSAEDSGYRLKVVTTNETAHTADAKFVMRVLG